MTGILLALARMSEPKQNVCCVKEFHALIMFSVDGTRNFIITSLAETIMKSTEMPPYDKVPHETTSLVISSFTEQYKTQKKYFTLTKAQTHLTSGEDLRYKWTDVIKRFARDVLECHGCRSANLAVAETLMHQWQHTAEDFWVIVHPLSKRT